MQNISINTSGLSEGLHYLYIRTQSEDGKWSITNQRQFYVYSDPPYATANNLPQIIKAEYYFDNLVDFGNGIDIPITTPGTDIDLQNISIMTSGLSEGLHHLYIRTQSADGNWSITNQKQFYVYSDPPYATANNLPQIIKAEYYFDNLVDFGNGIDIPITTPGTDIDLQNISIMTSGLSEGLHHLYIRTQSADGNWSITNQKQFYVYSDPPYATANNLPQIIKAEYYFDGLVDFGNGSDIPIATPGTDIDLQNISINTSGLSEGLHYLYIRTQSEDGKWSITNQKQFYVYSDPPYATANNLPQIIKAEYYFDGLVDFGNGSDIPIATPGTDIDLQNISINTSGLSEGLHYLYIRTQSEDGKWSITNQKQFYVYSDPPYAAANNLPQIIKAEYYFDNMVDFGNGIDIPITTPGTDIDLQDISINTNGLSEGLHHLYIRTKDENGRWSISNNKIFNVVPFQPYVDFENSEYYIKPAGTLIPSGQTLANFNYSTASPSHEIFNDGIYFPKVDHEGNNIWLRVRHIADDPNGTSMGYNVTKTQSSPFRNMGFGGWWGFLYEFDVYKDINVTGVPGYTLDGLFPVNVQVESIETLSPSELISFENLNSESTNWGLNTINFSGNNPNSNPGFSATNNTYSNLAGFTSLFPAASKNIYAVDKGSYPGYAEFRMRADNLSQFRYGYEYPDAGGYQGIRLYLGLPGLPSNDDCINATALIPSADNLFAGIAGTLNDATASSFLDCDQKQNADVWYKFTATARYHRIVLKNAVRPDSIRFQLYGGNCSSFYTIACVLNSRDSTVYDATDLNIGETYYLKVYSTNSFTSNGNFDIGIVSPPLSINKGLNILTNASFETPAMTAQATGVGNSFNGWFNRLGNPIAIIKEVSYPIAFGPDTASTGKQFLDMFGYDDTLYHPFSISTTSTIFFSGHFTNQAAQYYSSTYVPWTGFCGIMDENNILVAKSDIMNFTNKLTDKAWYQLSGTVYDLPPGNYKYIAFVSNYSNFDNAFVQANFNCPLLSQPPTSVTTDDADNTICMGTGITLTANGAVLASGASYAWFEGGCANGLLIGSGPTLTLVPSIGVHNYYVLVQEACGYTDCATVSITVIPTLAVSIIINTTANLNSLCEGSPVTFTATTTNTSNIATYQWKINGQSVGSNQPSFTTTTLAVNDVITCSVVTLCAAEFTSNDLIVTTVLPSLPNTISITTIATTICADSYAGFYASAPNVGYNPVIYTWKKNGVVVQTTNLNFPSSTIFNTSFYDAYNIANNDVITCEVTSSTACTLPATAVSNAIIISVSPANNASVSIDITSGTNPNCSGEPLTFTAIPTNGGTTPTYEWHKITGFPATNIVLGTNSPVFTLDNPAHNDVVYCSMTSSVVCSNPVVANSNSITVKAPTVLTGYINCNSNCNGSANVSTCGTATIQFSAISWNIINSFYYTNNSPSYQWQLNGSNVGFNSSNYSQTGFTNGDVITCTVVGTEPCSTPASLTLSMTVSVYDVSSASLSISGPGEACSGALATYYAQPVNAGPNPTYEWKLERNNVVSIVGTDYYYESNTLMTGDVISCSVTTDPVCATPISVQSSNSIAVTVSPSVIPLISITASNPASFLQNNFTAVISNGGSSPVYEWKKNGIVVGTNSNTYLDMALLTADEISCTLYGNADCASVSFVTSNIITVQPVSYCIPNTIYGYTACELAWISNVILGTTINKASGCAGFYTDYTTTDTLKTTGGQTIDFTITESTDGNNYGMYTNIYIDYNRDGDFLDADEKVTADIYTYVGGDAVGTFVVPVLIAPGSYHMRVMLNSNVLNACDLGFGEAEDYILQITQPDYCIPVISNPCDMWISNVTIGSINNSSLQPTNCITGGYTDYSSLLSTKAAPGQTVNFSLTGQSAIFFQQWQRADIYIDFNKDGDFDDIDEQVVTNFGFYAGTAYTGSFVIPYIQPYGYYRMRVKSYEYNEPQTGPCGNNTNGEIEDYMLIVNCVPNGSDIVAQGNNIDITDGDNTPDIIDNTDFGNVVINTTETRSYTIKNTGTNTLNISNVTLSSLDYYSQFFTVSSQPSITLLAPNASTTFTVQFTPIFQGVFHRALVHINNDNCDKKDYDFIIQATGACPASGPDVNIQGNGIDIARFDYTPSVGDNTDFGNAISNTAVSKTYTIQNTGDQPLNISDIQLFNYDNLQQFTVTAPLASTIMAGGSTQFTVTFNPAGDGYRYSYVRVNSNDCDESYYDFKVEGIAACPVNNPELNIMGNNIDIADGNTIVSTADNTDLGIAPIGSGITKNYTIQNTGLDPLHISGVDITGVNAAAFSVVTTPAAIVSAGNSTTFSIRFSPIIASVETATIHVRNDDCDEGDYDFTVSGTDGSPCIPVIQVPCSYVYISNVTLGTINNTSACSGGYSDYSASISTIVQQGQTVNFSVTDGGLAGQNVMIYADFNADGDFDDAGETLSNLIYSDAGTAATGSFIVPLLQPLGSYRLRIVSEYFGYGNATPCHNYNGEIEDYTLIVQSNTYITLNLKVYLQGYYTGSGTMQPVLNNQAVLNSLASETDTIVVELHDQSSFALIESRQALLRTDGISSPVFSQPPGSYYVAIKHRNTVQAWSANAIDCSVSTALYDFSIAANKAMGDNQVEVEPGVWALFTGDINQDDYIDGNDFPQYDSESASGGLYDGAYTPTDMNGDGFVDGNDFPVYDINSAGSVSAVHP
ncbi:MAG: choice-of-anchor D domain-containing protein [Ferruginibacter sp.]